MSIGVESLKFWKEEYVYFHAFISPVFILLLTFELIPQWYRHRLPSCCCSTQGYILIFSAPPLKCSSDSVDLIACLDSRPPLHPGFSFNSQCFAVLVLNVNFLKSGWFATQLVFPEARSEPADTGTSLSKSLPSWKWQSGGEVKDSGIQQIKTQSRRNTGSSESMWGFHWWLRGKESACQYRRHRFDPWIGMIPWGREWQLTPIFLSGESHEQKSLEGYSPQGHAKNQTWLSS